MTSNLIYRYKLSAKRNHKVHLKWNLCQPTQNYGRGHTLILVTFRNGALGTAQLFSEQFDILKDHFEIPF